MGKHLSAYSLALIAVVYLATFMHYGRWETAITSGGDAWGYYAYLPALFINHDLDNLEETFDKRKEYHPGFSLNNTHSDELQYLDDGNTVIKYTSGMATLYTPAFGVAHLVATLTDYPADGYSAPYMFMSLTWWLLLVLGGFYLLRKVLLNHLPDWVVAITLLMVAMGTNIFVFATHNIGMAHGVLFALFAALMYSTERWYHTLRWRFALFIGLSAGMITLIRPVDIFCLLIPLLWGLGSLADVKERLQHIVQHHRAWLLAAVCFVLVGVPQLLYWKYASGQWLYYSYGAEGFDFANPHLLWGMFGPKNGWLFYTPLMGFALLGCLLLLRHRQYLVPLGLLLPVHLYIAYSWWCWNYVNGFGSRPMIDIYAVLAIPLAWFSFYSLQHRFLRWLIAPLMLALVALNLFQSYQFSQGILWSEDANWAFVKASFGQTELSYLDLVTYDSGEPQPDPTAIGVVKRVYYNGFEDTLTDSNIVPFTNRGGVWLLDKGFSAECNQTLAAMGVQPGDWIKVGVTAMRKYWGNDLYRMSGLVTEFIRDKGTYKWRQVRVENKLGAAFNGLWEGRPDSWDEVYYWVKVPADALPNDVFKAYVFNNHGHRLYVDDLYVEVWR